LADAAFFFDTDKKVRLDSRLENLKTVIFQKELGSLHSRSVRIAKISGHIASRLGIQSETASRAGLLSKCDLISNMVGEFADLQGIMGKYYAEHDGESSEVAAAIEEQYLPKFSGDEVPQTEIGCVLSIAEKIDTITGLFSIGQPPTGSKDPFALRRAAIGLLRVIIEKKLDLDLCDCIEIASKSFSEESRIVVTGNQKDKILEFLLDRLQAIYLAEGMTPEVFHSVLSIKPTKPADFDRRIRAVAAFSQVDDSRALSDANKRVLNILSKNPLCSEHIEVDETLLMENAEITLLESLRQIEDTVKPMLLELNYVGALRSLVVLRKDIDKFFEDVLVNCEDEKIRDNRMAILWQLRSLFSTVADISLIHGN
jgi:glycyl-tRNA synthetase beta chain